MTVTPMGVKAAPKVKARMVLRLDDTGNLTVEGPVDNLILCYGMLDVARDVLHDHAMKRERRIVVPDLAMVKPQ